MIHDNDVLPNFFIIGAAKAGTTTLYEMLEGHPEILLPRIKEPHFFSNDLVYEKGLDWYAKTHYRGAQHALARGDATPHYVFYEKAASRIKASLPTSHHRFIVVLRNPVDRAYSLYWNMVHEGHETESFEDALRLEASRDFSELERLGTVRQQYVASGLYASQLLVWLRYFNHSCFHFILSEDLSLRPQETFSELVDFLGLKSTGRSSVQRRANSASQPRSRRLQNFLRRPSRLRHLIGNAVPFRLKRSVVTAILSMNRRSFRYPPMNPETRLALVAKFRPDIEQLEGILDRDLSPWLESPQADSSTERGGPPSDNDR